jgi:hypothetical protein
VHSPLICDEMSRKMQTEARHSVGTFQRRGKNRPAFASCRLIFITEFLVSRVNRCTRNPYTSRRQCPLCVRSCLGDRNWSCPLYPQKLPRHSRTGASAVHHPQSRYEADEGPFEQDVLRDFDTVLGRSLVKRGKPIETDGRLRESATRLIRTEHQSEEAAPAEINKS